MQLQELINNLLGKNQAFVSYRLPGAIEPITLLGGVFEQTFDWKILKDKTGFVVAPFVPSESFPFLFYKNSFQINGWNTNLNPSNFTSQPLSGKTIQQLTVGVDFIEYQNQVNHLVDILKNGDLQKVVLSRVLIHELSSTFTAGDLFGELCAKYPTAFVYIFNDGLGKLWVGATPETLLEADNGKAQTMSLAGTMPVTSKDLPPADWHDKEKEEQNSVNFFIREKLQSCGISEINEAPLEVKVAGPVVHLLKCFGFELPENLSVLELAMALHPTPAVCGLPTQKALAKIQKTELHNRAYYSGFIGPLTNQQSARLFVNLRCMQIVGKNALIFAGGGLLAASDAAHEWRETMLKAETLLSIIRKFN